MCIRDRCCTEVCPEHIKITDNAIIPLKERVVDAKYDPVAWLGRKIRKRTKRTAEEAAAEAPASGPAAVLPPGGTHGVPQPEWAGHDGDVGSVDLVPAAAPTRAQDSPADEARSPDDTLA